jgi:hypothetical protein
MPLETLCHSCTTPTGCKLSGRCAKPVEETPKTSLAVAAEMSQAFREMEREAEAKAEEAARSLVSGPATEAAVVQAQSLPAATGRLMLCIDCRWYDKKLTQPKLLGECLAPKLPINLITGDRRFPCIIARGYDALCGVAAQHWEKR